MNPLTNVKNINKLNETELSKGLVNKKSWHDLYKDSAWIFVGGLAYGLTEGDILCVFSQYGEIVNINLVRDKKTGKTKGFCFICYANQKSTILAVDNLNGIKLCGRTIRVDHVANYKPPKDNEHDDEITKMLKSEGCAPKPLKIESSMDEAVPKKKQKKHKKEKKKHKKRKKEDPVEEFSLSKVKREKIDEGYSKYELPERSKIPSRTNESTESESSDDSSESDSTHIFRKEKHKSHKPDRSLRNTDEKLNKLDKSRTNKHDTHHVEKSKHESRNESGSSSESDRHLNRERTSHFSDCSNGLSSEGRDLKHQRYKSQNSSSNEYSEKHKMGHMSKDQDVRSSSSRHHRHDSSLESERTVYHKKNDRNSSKDREKYSQRDSFEQEGNSYKVRRQEDPYSIYKDHRNRESAHKTDHHHYNDRRDYVKKREHSKNSDSKRDY